MRRLTKFEKEVAEFFITDEGDIPVTFERIYQKFLIKKLEDIVFRVRHPNDEDAITGGTIDTFALPNFIYAEDQYDKYLEFSRQKGKATKQFYDILNLLLLLEKNGLIYIELGYSYETTGYLPSRTNAGFLTASSIEVKKATGNLFFTMIDSKPIDDKKFHILLTSTFQTTSAFEIFVENGFRTEEQKQNDESNKHNKRNTIISSIAVGAAVLGVIVSGWFSYLGAKSNEDDNKNELFKNEVMLQVDRMTNDLTDIKNVIKQRQDTIK